MGLAQPRGRHNFSDSLPGGLGTSCSHKAVNSRTEASSHKCQRKAKLLFGSYLLSCLPSPRPPSLGKEKKKGTTTESDPVLQGSDTCCTEEETRLLGECPGPQRKWMAEWEFEACWPEPKSRQGWRAPSPPPGAGVGRIFPVMLCGGSWGVDRGCVWLFAQQCHLTSPWSGRDKALGELQSPSAPHTAGLPPATPWPALGVGHGNNPSHPKAVREGGRPTCSSCHVPQSPQARGRIGHGHKLPGAPQGEKVPPWPGLGMLARPGGI